ncbi:MAG: hypothetical protein IKO94_09105, partial [Selenomonadaceae bacterium]|nr:hypothetical protein [Selenomonadaceae bacterium]
MRGKICDAMGRGEYELSRKWIGIFSESDPVEAASLLVSSYIEEGDTDGAKLALEKLRRIHPEGVETRFLMARVAFMSRNCPDALGLLKSVPEEKIPNPWREKVYNLMGQCYRFLGDSVKSTECYFKASQAAETSELAALEYSNYLFNLHYLPSLAPEKARAVAQGYDVFFREVPKFFHRWRRKDQGKIRVGYVSPDFRNHVVVRFSYALLSAYDKERFEVFAYMSGRGDGVSCHLMDLVDGWRDISHCSTSEA